MRSRPTNAAFGSGPAFNCKTHVFAVAVHEIPDLMTVHGISVAVFIFVKFIKECWYVKKFVEPFSAGFV